MQHALLHGPRGRRLLLEYALASEELQQTPVSDGSLRQAVANATVQLDSEREDTSAMFGWGAPSTPPPPVQPAEVAKRLAEVPLAEVTPERLRSCLARAVGTATYWQAPDGADALAATEPLRGALVRVARHLAASPDTAWWSTPLVEDSQWAVEWEGEPPQQIPTTTRAFADGSPVGLWCVEDGMGWEHADSVRLGSPAGLRVYEIDSPQAWARLCARFPLEQTWQKRHEWYRVTGRVGQWVMPDWAAVAKHYDAVHLQVAAYLAGSGTVIPIDADTATSIAGWNPDETTWFTPNVRYTGERRTWRLTDNGHAHVWERVDQSL